MALKIVSGLDVTSLSLSSFLDLAKNELRNVQIHNLSTTQVNAISSPANGQLVYDTTLDLLKVYDGAAWQLVGAQGDDSTIELSSNTLSIKAGGVGTTQLAADAVTGAKLADNAVDSEHYTDGSIDSAHLAADVVTGAKIADNAIDSEHYTDGSIDAAHIASGAVTSAKIAADAVTAAKLADTAVTAGSYTAADITIDAQGRITAAASGSISTAEIADDAITAAKILEDAVGTSEIAQGAVTTTELGADAVTSAKIGDDQVNSEHIAAGAIDTEHIAALQVTTAKIAADAVTAAKIADNAVGAAQLYVSSDGTSGQVLTSDGDGTFSWANAGSDIDVNVGNLIARMGEINANVTIGAGTTIDTEISGDLSIVGDLIVGGTTTTVNSTTVTIDDPIFTLGGDTAPSSDDNKDRGIEFRYYDSAARLGFMGYDDSTGYFTMLTGATNTSEVFSGTKGTLEVRSVRLDASGIILNGTAVTSTAAELNLLDGVTATTAELNILDGVTSTAAELNILDGVSATAAELNILDGVTATTAELNLIDGVTATTAELNYVDGVTSAIQTQLNAKQATITGAATTIDDSNLTTNRAVISNGSGKVAVSAVTSTELGYLDGVTSAVQTQINTKARYYTAEITTVGNTLDIDASSHGILYPANVQLYDASNGQLVLADIVQTADGENTITVNAPTDTYDIVIVGRAS